LGTEARVRLSQRRRADGAAIAALLALAAAAWVLTGVRMAGMDAGPGTNPGSAGFFVSTWTVMMVAMMLPSAAPALASHPGAPRATAGYVWVWAASGLVAYGLLEAGRKYAPHFFAWHDAGRWAAVTVIALAAGYELTPFKRACLARCRRPGAARRPAADGRGPGRMWCLACFAGLMAALFALGAMSLVWMVVVSGAIAAQKLLARPRAATVVTAALLAALALGVALWPASVPALTVPHGTMSMHGMAM
jgi:predicted metal-binding membrane protein